MINHSDYDTCPVTDLAGTITLTETITQLVQPDHGDAMIEHRDYMVGLVDAARVSMAAQAKIDNEAGPAVSPVVVDTIADRAFGALYWRLRAATMLPDGEAKAAEGQKLLDRVYGDGGLAFLKLPYSSQLTQMKVRMMPIDGGEDGANKEPQLAERIDALAGPEYLANIRAQIVSYQVMVHGKSTKTSAPPPVLLDHLQALRVAIVHYASIVIGTIRLAKPETVVAARAMLAPIDNARTASNKKRAEGPARVGPSVIVAPIATVPSLTAPGAPVVTTPAAQPADEGAVLDN